MPIQTSRKTEKVTQHEHSSVVSEATTLRAHQTVVRVDGSAVTFTLTLPSVVEAAGQFFSFGALSTFSGTVTIAAIGSPEGWSNGTINATTDLALLYSDGRR